MRTKVFLYTMLILLLVIGSIYLFYSSQIKSAVTVTQQRQTAEVFAPLLAQLYGKTDAEIIAFAEEFHRNNASFHFCFETEDGTVLFQTDGFVMPAEMENFPNRTIRFTEMLQTVGNTMLTAGDAGEGRVVFLTRSESGLRLYVASTFSGTAVYSEILERAVWVFGFVFLASLLAAFVFARQMVKPIAKASGDIRAMSLLLPVDPPRERRDEIGRLSRDVYAMYDRLKSTIRQLETEVDHVRQMEENQRHFFSAASHELKTPIAAVGAILEGMLGGVVTAEEQPHYLREGMKLVQTQNKLVSEILELVKLDGAMPAPERASVRLRSCVDDALAPLSSLIESRDQRWTVDVDDRIDCEVNIGLFSRVLSNIFVNAAQNSPDGSEIRMHAEEESGPVRLTVWNGGTTIPADLLPKLFEPFYRADEARTSGEGRSGLGLAIVKKALDLMEIDFSVRNEDGGVLFQMEIPKGEITCT